MMASAKANSKHDGPDCRYHPAGQARGPGVLRKDQLASLPTDRLVSFSVESLDAPDPEEMSIASAWDAISELQRRADQESLDMCADLCLSPKPEERRVGSAILGQLGLPGDDPQHPLYEERCRCLATLLEREIAGDTNPKVLADVCIHLSHLHDVRTIAPVLRLRSHPSLDVRYGVAFALCGHDNEQAIACLIELSNDADAMVRDWATFGLGSQVGADTPAIRDALHARVTDPDDDTRREAVMGLARRQDRRVIPVLIEAFSSGRFDCHLLEVAAVLADSSVCPALMAARAHGLEREREGQIISVATRWKEAVIACKCVSTGLDTSNR